jgi:hypothetical protein
MVPERQVYLYAIDCASRGEVEDPIGVGDTHSLLADGKAGIKPAVGSPTRIGTGGWIPALQA